MKIVFTGGHHTSALPVIAEISQRYPDAELFWFGHAHTLEGDQNMTLEYLDITALGIPFFDLKAGKLYKTTNLKRLLLIPVGFFHALYLLLKIRPDLIFSFGGYLAVPTVIAGKLLGIQSVTHEQTVVAGHANKLISRFAKKIFVTWPQSLEYFPKEKTVVTGIPLRSSLFSETTTDKFNINPALPTVFVLGGKTGSHKINMAILNNLPRLLKITNIIHQCGNASMYNDYAVLLSGYEKAGRTEGSYTVQKFVNSQEISEAYSKATLVVTRAGAHAIAEVIALEKPALLIPIPWVSHNEQYKNAKVVVDSGLGQILDEKNLGGDVLYSTISDMLSHINTFVLKEPSLKFLCTENVATTIVYEISKLLPKN